MRKAMPVFLLTTTIAAWLMLVPAVGAAQSRTIESAVLFLADDAREGRGVGTAGLDAAAGYIADEFRRIGLAPPANGYYQRFELDPSAPALAHAELGAAAVTNVVGILPGRGLFAEQTMIIGAHYDHLGYGGSGSLDPDSTGVVHNGADDNASGTAALLRTAELLSALEAADRRTVVFIAFTAEELGLLGSDYYTKHPARPLETTVAMINFDMVGRLRQDRLIAIGTGSAAQLPALLDEINQSYRFDLATLDDPWGRSDHSSFYARGIPVVHLFTDNHTEYHRTGDDAATINLEGIERIARFAADLAERLMTLEEPPVYASVPQPPPAGGGGYGAYLGSIPDMSGSPGGVRLTGVREGSPAAEAGIVGGDIIVRMGEHEVGDLYDMTDALRAYHPGDTIQIDVMRDGERLTLTVTLGRRGG